MSKKRTRKDKLTAKHGFVFNGSNVVWKEALNQSPEANVKGQLSDQNSASKIQVKLTKNADNSSNNLYFETAKKKDD